MTKLITTTIIFIYLFFNSAYAIGIREIGDVMRIAIPMYAAGYSVREEGYEGLTQLTFSLLSAQVTSELLKVIVKEKRPDYEPGAKRNSFPSGHAVGAFSGAMFLHKRYGFKQSIVPYALATLTAYSRVEAKKHYVHDVIAGAVISGIWTWIFVDKYEKKDPSVFVSYDGESIRFSYRITF